MVGSSWWSGQFVKRANILHHQKTSLIGSSEPGLRAISYVCFCPMSLGTVSSKMLYSLVKVFYSRSILWPEVRLLGYFGTKMLRKSSSLFYKNGRGKTRWIKRHLPWCFSCSSLLPPTGPGPIPTTVSGTSNTSHLMHLIPATVTIQTKWEKLFSFLKGFHLWSVQAGSLLGVCQPTAAPHSRVGLTI